MKIKKVIIALIIVCLVLVGFKNYFKIFNYITENIHNNINRYGIAKCCSEHTIEK